MIPALSTPSAIPVRLVARVLSAAMLALSLAGCDMWIGTPAAWLPDSSKWLVLPMRAFVSRPEIDVVGMQLCTRESCGYEAAIARFNAKGAEAERLEAHLSQPGQLAALLGRSSAKGRAQASKVTTRAFASGHWTGIHIVMTGMKNHRVEAYIVSKPNDSGRSCLVVIAADPGVAGRLISTAVR